MSSSERRRHLRIRPLPELPAQVVRLTEGGDEAFEVADVGLGGFALRTAGSLLALHPGDEIDARIHLDHYGTFQVRAAIRHRSASEAGLTGIELLAPPTQVLTALRRYFAELMERGAPS